MTDAPSRRSILRGAFQLSVLGASVPLVTRRVFAGEPTLITPQLLAAYSCWLHYERRILCEEMHPEAGDNADAFVPVNTGADRFHFPRGEGRSWRDVPPPSTRAALVLSTVGLDLAAVQRECIHDWTPGHAWHQGRVRRQASD